MFAVLKTVQYNTNTTRSTGRHWRRQGWGQAPPQKGKVFPYSLPSVGPGADPGVQAVSPQVT